MNWLSYETPAYMFNVYKNQLSQQTGSRNLMGPTTLPTIWHTYMKLVTKYQISAINSCWEKCDKKYLGQTEVKQYTPPPPPSGGAGGIIKDYARCSMIQWSRQGVPPALVFTVSDEHANQMTFQYKLTTSGASTCVINTGNFFSFGAKVTWG